MHLGIDLDGVCYDFTAALAATVNLPMPSHLTWKFYEEWGWTDKEFFDNMRTYNLFESEYTGERLFAWGPEIPGASMALRSLHSAGHKIHVITHRSVPGAISNTDVWLAEHDIPFESISFMRDKTMIAVDLLLDDKIGNVAASLDAEIPAVLFDQPWNQDSDLPRVYGWTDFVQYVKEMAPFFENTGGPDVI